MPTTLVGSATAGMVATTMTTAVTTPASGPPEPDPAPEAGQADGPLDQVVAGRRDGQRDGDPEEVERPGRQAGPGPGEVDDHRPVPQVDAVGDGADEVQRPPGQGTGEPSRVRPAGRRPRRAPASAAQSRNPPSNMKLVGRPPGVPAVHPEHAEDDRRRGAHPVQGPARRARSAGGRAAARNAMVAPAMRSNRRVSVP